MTDVALVSRLRAAHPARGEAWRSYRAMVGRRASLPEFDEAWRAAVDAPPLRKVSGDFRTDESDGLTPSARRGAGGARKGRRLDTVSTIGDRLADDGQPLKVRTIQAALAALEDAGRVRRTPTAAGSAGQWCVVRMDSADEGDEDAF